MEEEIKQENVKKFFKAEMYIKKSIEGTVEILISY